MAESSTDGSRAVRLSICICTIGRVSDLERCLDSILAGSDLPYEVVVSDDSRNARVRELVEVRGFKYVVGPGRGLGPNRNNCIRVASGSHICFVDDDTVLLSHTAKCMMRAAGSSVVTGWELNYSFAPPERVEPNNADLLGYQTRPARSSRQIRSIVINATVFPMAIFDEGVVFSENVRYGYEELDIARQAVRNGYSIEFSEDLSIEHHPASTGRSGQAKLAEVARVYLTSKYWREYRGSSTRAIGYRNLAFLHYMYSRLSGGRPVRDVRDLAHLVRRYEALDKASNSAGTVEGVNALIEPYSVGVIVPTYRRPADLRRCIEAILANKMVPELIIVVCHVDDSETRNGIADFLELSMVRIVDVCVKSQARALAIGIESCLTDIVCITDDDAVPAPSWVESVVEVFRRFPAAVGVGGRDIVRGPEGDILEDGYADFAGIVRRGRALGNQHLRGEGVRVVDYLKGVNMSYRREFVLGLHVDVLQGVGAEPCNDMFLAASARRFGVLLHDPSVVVDHYPGNIDGRPRDVWPAVKVRALAENEMISIVAFGEPSKALLYMVRSLFVGTRLAPGVVLSVFYHVGGSRVSGILRSRIRGIRTGIRLRRKVSAADRMHGA